MMDQMMIVTLVLISAFSVVHGQSLQCFVCKNCPNLDDLDDTVSQRCDLVSPPNTPPTTSPNTPPTTSPNTPPTTSPNTPPTTTISTPNTPPTATPAPPTTSIPSLENDTLVYESIKMIYQYLAIAANNGSSSLSDENNDKATEQQRRSKPISPYLNIVKQLDGIHQCFRINRIVGDTTEVVRGCVVTGRTEHDTCVQANNGVAPLSCRICNYDDCNTAKRNTNTSIIIIFTSILSMTFLR